MLIWTQNDFSESARLIFTATLPKIQFHVTGALALLTYITLLSYIIQRNEIKLHQIVLLFTHDK